jgi:hypothetical protein
VGTESEYVPWPKLAVTVVDWEGMVTVTTLPFAEHALLGLQDQPENA